ncbi:response regulator transcription factor [Paraburkholderia sp. MMS20-SJTR3]|uniref:Response regulator transcription factor n=1 Tax=Paraburkholderia sejongensis TaxID=2886946 RepID=A0ABS8K0H3_9BURK|nr:response regulator transcription factor [Paraburkholderia sp. MMS20-SJTR3]MCC8395674.1 response regulator transcription factor [Paraburkholderia sp. MMS20-SJTR3]
MTSSQIRVIVADDHPVILEGVRYELERSNTISVVGTASNSGELMEALGTLPCDVLVSDYVMPGGAHGDGLALFSFIREQYPNLKIVVLSMMENPVVLRVLMHGGNICVFSKADPISNLTIAVHAAYANGRYLSPRMVAIADSLKLGARGNVTGAPLTRRELEVVRFYVSGMSVTEIATLLRRSKKTISTQKGAAMLKLGIDRDADLVRYGMETGLVMPSASIASSEFVVNEIGPPKAV